MSGLTVSLAAYNAIASSSNVSNDDDNAPSSSTTTQTTVVDDSLSPSSSGSVSPSSSYSALPSLSSSSTASASTSSLLSPPELPTIVCAGLSTRVNEHLAVLLPKPLWKPDAAASQCDNFYCRVRFSILERRHHCRKCGGVYCSACTSRSIPLLDTSNLDFVHPPRNVPIYKYESPESPILLSRVCDECWDQIHGCPSSPRTPDLVRSGSISPISFREPLSPASIDTTPLPSAISRRKLRPMPSISSLTSTHSHSSQPPSRRISLRSSTQPPLPAEVLQEIAACAANPSPTSSTILRAPVTAEPERSYGELDAYPLKRHSAVCKITGGGRWTPEETRPHPGYRIPGGKAPYELEMEKEEEEARKAKANPIVRDRDFRYRFQRPQQPEPIVMARSPLPLSTF